MKSYLLKLDNDDLQYRKILIEHYSKRKGRKVPYAEVIRIIQEKDARALTSSTTTHA